VVEGRRGGVSPAELVETGGSMRILPHRHGTDGAFAARLVRKP
jgi:16S rRNA C967 or C1407 C5-methylase (RsmB/RsmF family)